MAQVGIERAKIIVMDNKNCKTCLYCKNYKKLRFAGLGQKMIYECHIEPPKTVLTMFNKPKAYQSRYRFRSAGLPEYPAS